eukprot:SAG31_NODE_44391_length_263_cov_0.621951_1_plen_45_part_10
MIIVKSATRMVSSWRATGAPGHTIPDAFIAMRVRRIHPGFVHDVW